MFEQRYSFGFEAAHELSANVEAGHAYAHIHGHSFQVTVVLAGQPGDQGWLMDFGAVRSACESVRLDLDHRFLNRIEGLERPTLERLAVWIFERLRPGIPPLAAVEIARPSLSEQVAYRPG